MGTTKRAYIIVRVVALCLNEKREEKQDEPERKYVDGPVLQTATMAETRSCDTPIGPPDGPWNPP